MGLKRDSKVKRAGEAVLRERARVLTFGISYQVKSLISLKVFFLLVINFLAFEINNKM